MREHEMSMIQPVPDDVAAGPGLGAEMDRLALVQALHDFEVANARVVDLTQRLIGTGRELAALRVELSTLQREHEALRAAHDAIQRSRAYKLATMIFAIRKAL
jgi:hypothetical protein